MQNYTDKLAHIKTQGIVKNKSRHGYIMLFAEGDWQT